MILLDTNVCVRILRGRKDALEFFSRNAGNVAIPFMVLGELYFGAGRSKNPQKGKVAVDRLAQILPIVNSTTEIMAKVGMLKSDLAAKGMPVEDADVLIAATALVHGMPVATGNVRHFSRFANLEVIECQES